GRLRAESSVADLRGGASLVVRAEPMVAAASVAERLLGSAAVSTMDGAVRLDVKPDQAPELVRALVRADIDVHEVHYQERTLEDAFFALTGDALTDAKEAV